MQVLLVCYRTVCCYQRLTCIAVFSVNAIYWKATKAALKHIVQAGPYIVSVRCATQKLQFTTPDANMCLVYLHCVAISEKIGSTVLSMMLAAVLSARISMGMYTQRLWVLTV